jgi:2'-5' RNA ligase
VQLSFDFCRTGPRRPERPERLFFGLLPDTATSARIARFGDRFLRAHRLDGTRIGAERLHVSLHHIGNYRRLRPAFIYAATEAARSVSMPPFEIELGIIKSFDIPPGRDGHPQKRPLVLLGEGVAGTALHKTLGASMAAKGLRPGGRFVPHVTLLYSLTAVPAEAIRPIRFAVREFVLIHSKLGLAQHEVIGRWPLNG